MSLVLRVWPFIRIFINWHNRGEFLNRRENKTLWHTLGIISKVDWTVHWFRQALLEYNWIPSGPVAFVVSNFEIILDTIVEVTKRLWRLNSVLIGNWGSGWPESFREKLSEIIAAKFLRRDLGTDLHSMSRVFCSQDYHHVLYGKYYDKQ